MAPKLGIPVLHGNQYYQVAGQEKSSAISYADWLEIVAYYKTLAPVKLAPAKAPEPLLTDWSIFALRKPEADSSQKAMTTLVAIDPNQGGIYSSSAHDAAVYHWNQTLQPTRWQILPSPAVYACFPKHTKAAGHGVFTCIGTMLATDAAQGQLLQLDLNDQAKKPEKIATGLLRPIQSVGADLDKDGFMDWVVCSFGHNTGGAYWLKQLPNHQFKQIPLRQEAGATQAVIQDFNHDGWSDVLVLFAHADEGIWVFLNDQRGGFTPKNLLRFLPIYGSTSFQLVDFNADNKLDILYTSGDNSDYSRVLKPYHGMYILLNEGNDTFKQAYFYPINGCTKAIAADFDQDGDQDIATIAFFADLVNNPAETFIYFEQDRALHFNPHAIPVHTYGRWICMDVNDYDRDGDSDIVLGNYAQGFMNDSTAKVTWNEYLPLILLENKHH